MAMAGLYEIWRDPTRDDGRPAAVPLDLHGAHHHRRGRGRSHPRPDAAAGRAGALGRLARPGGRRRATTCSKLLVPGRARPARGLPGLHRGQQRPQQRPGAARRRSPAEDGLRDGHVTTSRVVADPARRRPPAHGPLAAPDRDAAARPRRRRRRRRAATWWRWPRRCPRQGISVVRVEQPWRVAGKKVAPRPEVLDACFVAAADALRVRTPLVVGGRSAGARSRGPYGARARRLGLPRAVVPAAPAGQAGEVPARRARGGAGADARGAGRARPVRPPRGVPAGPRAGRRPGGGPRLQGAQARRRSPRRRRWRIVVEAALEWIVRDVGR